MEIVIMRHGQTDGNKEGRYLGRTDVPLNEAGEAEAVASGVLPGVKKVYVSPMIRARRTAELCFPNAALVVVPDFREMDFGIFEGLNYEEMTGNEEYQSGWTACAGENAPGVRACRNLWTGSLPPLTPSPGKPWPPGRSSSSSPPTGAR